MDIALDLGTANSRLRVNDSENAIDEPSVIAMHHDHSADNSCCETPRGLLDML